MSVRILIVEDEPGIADFLVRGLTEEGYAVSHVDDGNHAWLRMQSQTWDLVILDWWLPGEDGLQILKRFRHKNRNTPVLFLTARDGVNERATRADAPLDLTAKELSLLSMFLRRPGRVLSRTRIYETVWDENFDGLSNTLEVHVKDLRGKLEKHGSRVIQTRRGQGYILEMPRENE